MKYQDEIVKIIVDTIKLTERIEDMKINCNLQNIGLDSLTFVRCVIELENHFDIEFPDDKLMISQANTIKDLCEIVMKAKGENDEIKL